MKYRALVFILPFVFVVLIISSCVTFMFNDSVYRGDYFDVKKYIEKGVNVNAINTALRTASGYGHTEVVKLLIEAGADVNIRSKEGDTQH